MNLTRTTETKAIIKEFGGVTATAKALGVSAAAVSKWSRVPEHHTSRIVELTGKTRDQIASQQESNPDGKNPV